MRCFRELLLRRRPPLPANEMRRVALGFLVTAAALCARLIAASDVISADCDVSLRPMTGSIYCAGILKMRISKNTPVSVTADILVLLLISVNGKYSLTRTNRIVSVMLPC